MTNEELVEQIQAGNNDLISELWEQLEPLIKWAARRFYVTVMAANSGTLPGGIEVKDLCQHAYFGLSDAIKTYDPGKGAAFSTFLMWHLRKSFQDCIGRTQHQQRDPLNHAMSLFAPVGNDDGDEEILLDRIPNSSAQGSFQAAEKRMFNEQLRVAIDMALDHLPAREATAIRDYYFSGRTQAQIGEDLNCNAQRVAQLQRQGLNHIRRSSDRQKLEAYLDDRTDFYGYCSKPHAIEEKVLWREKLRIRYEACDDEPESGHFANLTDETNTTD